jgi:hypothetical protein
MTNPLGLQVSVPSTELRFTDSSWIDVYNECRLSNLRYKLGSRELTLKLIKFYGAGPAENGLEIELIFQNSNLTLLDITGGLDDLGTISNFTLLEPVQEDGSFKLRIELNSCALELNANSVEIQRQKADENELRKVVADYKKETGDKRFPGSNVIENTN